MVIKKTTDKFKEELYLKFPNLQVIGEYLGSKKVIEVQCCNGHSWGVIPGKILDIGTGSRCRICEKVLGANRKSPRVFLQEIKDRFPNLTLLEDYVTSTTKLKVRGICGHSWDITPNTLLSRSINSECSICIVKIIYNKKGQEQISDEINVKYPNIHVVGEYTGSNDWLKVKCDQGHERDIIPNLLLNRGINSECLDCLNKSGIFSDKVITKYDNISTVSGFIGTRDSVLITGVCGHTWEASSAANLLYYGSKSTCNICNPAGISIKEREVHAFIKQNYSGWVELNDRSILEGRELDIVLPDLGIAIEFNGIYWHQEIIKGKSYHRDKTSGVNSLGYQLIHINEDEWYNKQDIVKSRIRSLLNITDRIYARNCEVRQIGFPKDFLNTNHLQGAGSPSSYNYGLFLKEELVAVMTFSTPRFSTKYDYELVRYCSLLDITVTGGASKLLKNFTKEHVGSIISYSDRRWSKGSLYNKLGFRYSHTSEPNYKYYKGYSSLSRYECQKHLLKKKFPNTYKDELTEKEIMSLEGYYPVYDSGNDVWTK